MEEDWERIKRGIKMINIEAKIKEFEESIKKLKALDSSMLTPKQRKEIDSTETRYLIYCKELSVDRCSCKGIYFVPYSHKKFKTILKRLEKSYTQYGEIEIEV